MALQMWRECVKPTKRQLTGDAAEDLIIRGLALKMRKP